MLTNLELADFIDAYKISSLHEYLTEIWHIKSLNLAPSCPEDLYTFEDLIIRNHKMNFDIWHTEDIARRADISSDKIMDAKRKIDNLNQERNNTMELIDEWFLNVAKQNDHAALHSETLGMMIDRLSILALKYYHMIEESRRESADNSHKTLCETKARCLNEQIMDLTFCLKQLLIDIENGVKKIKIYRQFKMYNDPALNPELYNNSNGRNL